MFRFTIRDLLWLMVVMGLVLVAWWEWQRANQAVAERDEAIERWHEASKKWVEVNRMKAEEWGGEFRQHGRMGGARQFRCLPRLRRSSAIWRAVVWVVCDYSHENVRDEELISFINQWVTFLESEDYEHAFAWTDHEPQSGLSGKLIRWVIKNYGEANSEQRVTLDGWSYEKGISQRKKVTRWDQPTPNGGLGYIWYDLNIDERCSDLTALFNFYAVDDGVIIKLESIHVM